MDWMSPPRGVVAALLLAVGTPGCKTGVVETVSDQRTSPTDGPVSVVDAPRPTEGGVFPEGGVAFDLTATAGDPCTYGKCGPGLICMANLCHSICSTDCGDKAPECQPNEGCHWVTSFAAACLPGSAKYPETCGGGVFCIGGYLCVNISGKGTMCLTLCKYGCPSGTTCGQTNNGCNVCIPY
jgi:hypothetical protein